MRILALDIGGANTKKIFYNNGKTISEIHYFPLWKKKNELNSFLESLKEKCDTTAVTMTGELSDVFSSKEEGSVFIAESCKKIFENALCLTNEKKLVKFKEIKNFLSLASANWLASVYLLEKKFKEGLLIDIGSTTIDIIPFGKGIKHAKSDLERLVKGQLIYTGFLRTPIGSVVQEVPYKGKKIGVSSEYFAITADVYNVLLKGKIDYFVEAPDGRGKTVEESERRIARLFCADLGEIGEKEILKICKYIADEHIDYISRKIKKVANGYNLKKAYIAGSGEYLGVKACEKAGLKTVKLNRIFKHSANLPCLGLVEMCLDWQSIS